MQSRWLAVVFGVAAVGVTAFGVTACGVSNDHLGEVDFPGPPGLADGGVIDGVDRSEHIDYQYSILFIDTLESSWKTVGSTSGCIGCE